MTPLRQDLARYTATEWLTEPSVLVIAIYRFGRWIDRERIRLPFLPAYFIAHYLIALLTGISIPKSAQIGPGLRIFHFGGIVIHPLSVIGANATIGHGVTLGVRESPDDAPVLGDNVVLGAYAQILGGIRVGDGAKVGAMAVVLKDVSPDTAVAGNPARIVGDRR